MMVSSSPAKCLTLFIVTATSFFVAVCQTVCSGSPYTMGPTSTSTELQNVLNSWGTTAVPTYNWWWITYTYYDYSSCVGTIYFTASNKAYTLAKQYAVNSPAAWTLDATGTTGVSIAQTGGTRFVNANGGRLTIKGLTLQDGAVPYYGGCLFGDASSTITLESCTLKNCRATSGYMGGGVYFEGTLTATNTIFQSNVAQDGGAVTTWGGTATFTGCTFQGNTAGWGGGGALVYGITSATVSFISCNFTGNSAGVQGGGIRTDTATMSLIVQSGIFTNNWASGLLQDVFVTGSPSRGPFTCSNTCAFTSPSGLCVSCPTMGK